MDRDKCIIDLKPWCAGSWDREAFPSLGPILLTEPQGIPDLVKPNFEVVGFDRIKKTVENCGEMGILNSQELELWDQFLADERKYQEAYDAIEAINYSKLLMI